MSADLLVHVEAASAFWQRGDKAVANLRLVFARLPHLHEPADADRLSQAEYCLDQGLCPRALMKALDLDPSVLDLIKYDPNQPRVPAGSGSTSGQWGSGAMGAFIAPFAAAARAAGPSFLRGTSPAIIEALATFAARFATPTAVLGALFIPTPNGGGVTDGTLPDAPDIRYRRDSPAGTLRLARTQADGSEVVVVAQNRRGVYVDVATDAPLGRDFGEQFYLDLPSVAAALAPRDHAQQAAADDEPQLCPAPVEDNEHKPKDHTLDYEDDVHRRVNPLAPIPRGFAVKIIDPKTGEEQFPDDCFRYAGDLVDGDMRPGDFADAKGEEYLWLLQRPFGRSVMEKLVDATTRHLRAAEARGARLKVYFAEQGAANLVRKAFDDRGPGRVIVGVLPPSKPKPRGRSR